MGLALTCFLAWVTLFQLLRTLLLVVNRDLAGEASWQDLLWSFAVGLRFDVALTAWLLLPLLAPGRHRPRDLGRRCSNPRVDGELRCVG